MTTAPLKVLFVPDSTYWVTGTIAKNIARFNPWIKATIASGPVIDQIFSDDPALIKNFDLVHFTCPYASKQWLPRFREMMPCVTSHHHVTEWDALKHNLEGDAIVVGSPEWKEDLRERGADLSKVFCVPYGVDATLFHPTDNATRLAIRGELGIKSEAPVIGFFGKNSSNDDDRKGVDVFVRALRRLNKSVSDLTVLIIGPGWQTLKVELLSSSINCIWVPFVPELRGLAKMYQALDFYWVTARVEGGPVTLLEAMSCEVCCLTTPVGIAREIVRDGENGVMLPFNDAEAFAERTVALLRNPEERTRLARNGRSTILREMHVAVTTEGIHSVYEKAVSNFENRHPRGRSLSFSKPAGDIPTNELATEDGEYVALSGFPQSIHRRVRMLETLAWCEHLILYHSQRAIAFKLILREWIKSPASTLPLRVLLRRFLPRAMVSCIVKLKNRSQAAAPVAAGYPTTKKA